MSKPVEIMGTEVSVKEYKGQRVVTFKDIDTVHQRPEGTAYRNFNINKNRFIEGTDFFLRNSSEAKIEYGIIAPNGLVLITETGYLMLVKSFTDDLAWEVQRCLVNTYFKAKSRTKQQNPYAYANAKDAIAKWKQAVAYPLANRLGKLIADNDTVSIYRHIYVSMETEFAFDMNAEKADYCGKYDITDGRCSIIDVIADNKELRRQFVECTCKRIKQMACDRVIDAEYELRRVKEFSRQCDVSIENVHQVANEFETVVSEYLMQNKRDCFIQSVYNTTNELC